MREWIIYHLQIGIDKFYLYDNTGTLGHKTSGGAPSTSMVNKYGFNFNELLPYTD